MDEVSIGKSGPRLPQDAKFSQKTLHIDLDHEMGTPSNIVLARPLSTPDFIDRAPEPPSTLSENLITQPILGA